ncbi:hypothetical protein B0T10DRAFT_563585 [Thelonectria olida]|uniref:Oxidoreductase-like protein n=1 Tax=Thelonectria olida TaxID=1576542 RepID=A0A9P8VZZ7_9HYPO|nr:hypothetical protein B0T10DRAFT_563585 [Thelonectria olida]
MEARSLTALNNLAANPPQYPVNPTDERQEPLTLYISRVPGTRDVILSPFKPQQKIVSAEDVASSLYYIHMEQSSSNLAYPPPVRDDGFGSSSDEGSSARNIPRKPLPGSAHPLAPSSRDHLPVPGNENLDPLRPRGHTFSSPFDETRMTPPQYEQDTRRSLDGRGTDQPRTDWTPAYRRSSHSHQRQAAPPPPYGPEVTMIDTDRANMRTLNPRRNMHASRSPSPRKQGESSYTNPFTLAFIRRDPSTGNQWNVAHVSSYQSETTVHAEPDESGPFFPTVPPVASVAANPPINIQIETLGYGKFRNMPTRRSFDVGPGDGLPPDARVPVNDGAVLSRQVLMGYAKTWSTNFRQRWNQDGRGEHGRHGSVASVDSTGSGELVSPGPQTSLGQPLPGMRPRGYVFTSPWNGRCEFRTGTTGRSLRCYHILSDDKTSINNMVEQQGVTLPAPGGAMPLSELRFNLPSRELFKTPEGREEVKTQIQGHFNKLLQRFDNRNEHSDEDDGTVSPFDVNLGKEKAGGGKHGKRAKLGKLIIYPDGLKMLDLVVAANMGVWWGAWERSF